MRAADRSSSSFFENGEGDTGIILHKRAFFHLRTSFFPRPLSLFWKSASFREILCSSVRLSLRTWHPRTKRRKSRGSVHVRPSLQLCQSSVSQKNSPWLHVEYVNTTKSWAGGFLCWGEFPRGPTNSFENRHLVKRQQDKSTIFSGYSLLSGSCPNGVHLINYDKWPLNPIIFGRLQKQMRSSSSSKHTAAFISIRRSANDACKKAN